MSHLDIQLDREDVILLLLEANHRLLGRLFLSGVTRLEKLIYLLERETDFDGIARFFPFEPYNFGPFSKEVYEAVDFLTGCDLLLERERAYLSIYEASGEQRILEETSDEDSEIPQGVKEREFGLSDKGRIVAKKLREAILARRPEDIEQLETIVQKYGTWPLRQLIRYVYRRYPEMTIKSIHPEASRIDRIEPTK